MFLRGPFRGFIRGRPAVSVIPQRLHQGDAEAVVPVGELRLGEVLREGHEPEPVFSQFMAHRLVQDHPDGGCEQGSGRGAVADGLVEESRGAEPLHQGHAPTHEQGGQGCVHLRPPVKQGQDDEMTVVGQQPRGLGHRLGPVDVCGVGDEGALRLRGRPGGVEDSRFVKRLRPAFRRVRRGLTEQAVEQGHALLRSGRPTEDQGRGAGEAISDRPEGLQVTGLREQDPAPGVLGQVGQLIGRGGRARRDDHSSDFGRPDPEAEELRGVRQAEEDSVPFLDTELPKGVRRPVDRPVELQVGEVPDRSVSGFEDQEGLRGMRPCPVLQHGPEGASADDGHGRFFLCIKSRIPARASSVSKQFRKARVS